jgi:hypothetical protein
MGGGRRGAERQDHLPSEKYSRSRMVGVLVIAPSGARLIYSEFASDHRELLALYPHGARQAPSLRHGTMRKNTVQSCSD